MRIAQNLSLEVKFTSLGDNLFTSLFSCLGDRDKVMEGSPWQFFGSPVILSPYDGFSKLSIIELFKFEIWIQIHDLSYGYGSMVESLASMVGEFEAGETPSSNFSGNFYWARVLIDVRKPLKNHVSMVKDCKCQFFLFSTKGSRIGVSFVA